jgi:uncharacterized protein
VIIVSNTTILIGLTKIGRLDLLPKIFPKIYIPDEVYRELVEKGKKKPASDKIKRAKWIETKSVRDRTPVNLLLASLEKGEAEVLCLAKEMKADLLLLDEEKARKSATLAGFEVMGTVGFLLLAKELGLIKEIRFFIDELQKKRFRISEGVVIEALRKAGEIH